MLIRMTQPIFDKALSDSIIKTPKDHPCCSLPSAYKYSLLVAVFMAATSFLYFSLLLPNKNSIATQPTHLCHPASNKLVTILSSVSQPFR